MKTKIAHPIARNEGVIVEAVGDETIVYDLETKEVHCLKPLAAVVYALADGRQTCADLAELAAYRLGRSVSADEASDAIAQLEQRRLLDATPIATKGGVSRRQALQRFAAVGTGAALVTTIMAPTALAAGSQIPTGNCCGSTAAGDTCTGLNSSCSSKHCCQNNAGKSCNECKCVGGLNDCSVQSAGCTLAPDNCPAGQQCVTLSNGTTACCSAVTAPGGGIVNC